VHRRHRALRHVVAIALTLLPSTSRLARAQGEESATVLRALDLENAGKYREAAQLFRSALRTTPSAGALLGLERAYAELGMSDSLLAPLDSLIARRPREPLFRSVQLRTLQILRKEDLLRAAFERWVRDAPRDPAPYREYARLLLQLGRSTAADSIVQRGRISSLGGARDLEYETAQLRAAQGQWLPSAEAWRRALADAPHLAGAAAYALAPTPAATRDAIRAVFLAPPASSGTRSALAELEVGWGRPREAWEALRVLSADTAAARVWSEFGERALAEERYAIARDAFAAALRVHRTPTLARSAATAALRAGSPADVFTLAPLSEADADPTRDARDYVPLHVEALAALGKGTEAEAVIEKYDRYLAPGQRMRLARTLAAAWVRAGDLAHARAALRAAGEDADSSESAGWLALYEGRLGRARALLSGARTPGPELAVALGIVARTRGDTSPELGSAFLALARGDSGAAAAQFVTAAGRHPEAASVILLAAARLHAARGDDANATALWQRIVMQYADSPEAAESELEWARALRRRGDAAGATAHLEHLILSAPQSALLPQARRELELTRGAVPSP
jgi:tetratricopeptide (TPR) repeat protein